MLPLNTNEPFVSNSYVPLRCKTTTTITTKWGWGWWVGGREAPHQTVCALFQGGAWPLNELNIHQSISLSLRYLFSCLFINVVVHLGTFNNATSKDIKRLTNQMTFTFFVIFPEQFLFLLNYQRFLFFSSSFMLRIFLLYYLVFNKLQIYSFIYLCIHFATDLLVHSITYTLSVLQFVLLLNYQAIFI